MPKAYAPVLAGLCLVAFARFRLTVPALVLAAIATLGLVVARWGVPLGPGSAAARVAQEFPMLGQHPYCFHDSDVQGLFGRTYDCYRHHVVPGKISVADSNDSLVVRASDSGITDITRP
jgi:hypothetical protein